jgi:hypothetical protein
MNWPAAEYYLGDKRFGNNDVENIIPPSVKEDLIQIAAAVVTNSDLWANLRAGWHLERLASTDLQDEVAIDLRCENKEHLWRGDALIIKLRLKNSVWIKALFMMIG